jgi:hypothetical protein
LAVLPVFASTAGKAAKAFEGVKTLDRGRCRC